VSIEWLYKESGKRLLCSAFFCKDYCTCKGRC